MKTAKFTPITRPDGPNNGAHELLKVVRVETFFVNLSNATNATIVDGQAVGTIKNDD